MKTYVVYSRIEYDLGFDSVNYTEIVEAHTTEQEAVSAVAAYNKTADIFDGDYDYSECEIKAKVLENYTDKTNKKGEQDGIT